MKKLKKVLIFAAIVAALTCLLCVALNATQYSGNCGKDGNNVTWSLDTETGVLKIEGNGAMKYYSSSSNAPWYNYRSSIKTAKIGDRVTSIGQGAFSGCSSLTSIMFDDNSQLTSIEVLAFSGCSSLTSIEMPNGVTSIGGHAFYSCRSLTSIEILDSVTSIGNGAFSGCNSLTSINVDETNETYKSIDGVLFSKDEKTLIAYPNGKSETTYTIPNCVTSIENYAFSGCSSLTSIEIPDSVTSIGEGAFNGCSSLTSIEIPNSVTSIGDWAFEYCSSLTSIEIPNGVTSIGEGAFYYCSSLTSIEIPSSVTSIGYDAFYNCGSLTSIEIPSSVTSIAYYAFYNCGSLTSIKIFSDTVEIYDGSDTISSTATIYGYKGSTAEAYAAKYNRKFVAISNIIVSGTCGAEGDGSNLTWTLDTETGVLRIEGKGGDGGLF